MTFLADPQVPLLTAELLIRDLLELGWTSEPTIVHVHHDTEAHARSFNEGYEAAITQGLADDPTLADDWLQTKLREARVQALREAAEELPYLDRPKNMLVRQQDAAHWLRARATTLGEEDEQRVPTDHGPKAKALREKFMAPPASCPARLTDGRNELRCWLTAGHEGDHK